ncbi:tumor necrosis factor receptor superfamily member 9 isoform X2 [Hemicordylus capensis]|uniref:tumor necrosis factor receptor superfamily member 9 isoform X2 n=1 Tax=Hemicordylus capensis TaxID=884348 RepID=UPI0023022274|nr:tumor necrosis factor receptor superfamily member 9 isoform X2 [Hemicordylus capensis]
MGGSRGRRPPPAALLLLLLLLQLLLWSPGRVCGERPCPTATYRDHTTGDCKLCKTCDGIREYETKCSATANAVCRCVPKFRCGSGSLCELCECTEGQELTEQGCQSCPEGTFNDRPAGSCQPWKQDGRPADHPPSGPDPGLAAVCPAPAVLLLLLQLLDLQAAASHFRQIAHWAAGPGSGGLQLLLPGGRGGRKQQQQQQQQRSRGPEGRAAGEEPLSGPRTPPRGAGGG